MSNIVLGIDCDTFRASSFSFKNKAIRFIWNCIYTIFFRFSPKPFHIWRCFLLRLFGACIGKNCHIYPSVVIWAPWNLRCGDESCIADHVVIYNQAPIYLGKRCVISQGTHLCTGSHDYRTLNLRLVAESIIIRDYVWVAAECFIHPGITIGEYSVIGARSVVSKNIPPHVVCVGHPCRPIKRRILKSDHGCDVGEDKKNPAASHRTQKMEILS